MANHQEDAKVVVIGGGVIGLSTAYHLGRLGCRDVILVERNELTSGTSWHGLLESDGFRQAFLRQVAAGAGRRFTPAGVSFAAVRERQLDLLGDLIEAHAGTGSLLRLIEQGPPPGLPFIPPGAP